MPRAKKPAMYLRMTGKMDHAQTTPKWQMVSVGNEVIDDHGSIVQDVISNPLHPSAPARYARVRIRSVNMSLFCWMSVDRRICEPPRPKKITGVIEMTMRQ